MHSNAILLNVLYELFHCAGRSLKEGNLYAELAEGIYSYGVTQHRHGKFVCLKNWATMLPQSLVIKS